MIKYAIKGSAVSVLDMKSSKDKIDKNQGMEKLMKYLYLRSYRRDSISINPRAYSKEDPPIY